METLSRSIQVCSSSTADYVSVIRIPAHSPLWIRSSFTSKPSTHKPNVSMDAYGSYRDYADRYSEQNPDWTLTLWPVWKTLHWSQMKTQFNWTKIQTYLNMDYFFFFFERFHKQSLWFVKLLFVKIVKNIFLKNMRIFFVPWPGRIMTC